MHVIPSLFKGWFSLAHAHKHNASEDSSNISINISTGHKNEHTCFSYVVLTRNHRYISIRMSTRKTNIKKDIKKTLAKNVMLDVSATAVAFFNKRLKLQMSNGVLMVHDMC